jgi:hypothetical protein
VTGALLDYTGPRSRLDPSKAPHLGSSWAFQTKHDGIYVRLGTDRHGKVCSVLGRNGQRPAGSAQFIGLATGVPMASLAAEAELHTEAGIRIAASRGFPVCHVFDMTSINGRSIIRQPYRWRRDAMWRARASAELGDVDPWLTDAVGDCHDPDTGRYVAPVPIGCKRFPIVEQVRSFAEAWRAVEHDGAEGVVAVRLDAEVGGRRAKVKVKRHDLLDCTVLEVADGVARLGYGGLNFLISCRGRISRQLTPGIIVSTRCDGWYEKTATPRFARIESVRYDLSRIAMAA